MSLFCISLTQVSKCVKKKLFTEKEHFVRQIKLEFLGTLKQQTERKSFFSINVSPKPRGIKQEI